MAYKDHARALDYWRNYNAKRRVAKPPSARQVAIENGETHYISEQPCVNGHRALRRVKDRICTECDRVQQGHTRKVNPEQHYGKKKISYERNKEHHLAQKKLYRQANKGKLRALNAARKEVVKLRTPTWLSSDDKWLIREIYELAALRTEQLGFQWDVDHRVPLQGELVSGLHVPWNMQVIPAIENIRKKNKFEVGHA